MTAAVRVAAGVALAGSCVAGYLVAPPDDLLILARDVPALAGYALLGLAFVAGAAAIVTARVALLVASLGSLFGLALVSPADRVTWQVLLFAATTFLFLELGHAVVRFERWRRVLAAAGPGSGTDVDRLASRYLSALPKPLAMVFGLAALGLLFFRLLSPLLPGLLADSLELQGVYGAVLGSALVIGLAWGAVRFVRRGDAA